MSNNITSERIMSLDYFLKLKTQEEKKLFVVLWNDCGGDSEKFKHNIKNFDYLPEDRKVLALKGSSNVLLRDQNKIINTINYDCNKFEKDMNIITKRIMLELKPKEPISINIESGSSEKLLFLLKVWINCKQDIRQYRKSVVNFEYLPVEKRRIAKSSKITNLFKEQSNILYVLNKYPDEFKQEMNFLTIRHGEMINQYFSKSKTNNKAREVTFLNDLLTSLGEITGSLLGGAIGIVGDITGSSLIKEIGDEVENTTKHTGRTLGKLADGTSGVLSGVLTGNSEKIDQGIYDVGTVAAETLINMGKRISSTIETSVKMVDSIIENDSDSFKKHSRKLMKRAVIISLPIPIFIGDALFEGMHEDLGEEVIEEEFHISEEENDIAEINMEDQNEIILENPNAHHVRPHEVHGKYGYYHRGGENGYEQTNPDYHKKV
ncbi:hypothetical protein QFZ81_001021 [Paenibacillus sp. V4I9]|uniref:hypothetical protein n=1 Tax=Paenibacillus sp. V4I9 TaxID=3042308 RepID=UPI0027876989|nr:hypothetical protein [Paenibacillus sp. V4I9]MDQ0885933.1 hypothetical protein [Paenibacillus sp. V4I9]